MPTHPERAPNTPFELSSLQEIASYLDTPVVRTRILAEIAAEMVSSIDDMLAPPGAPKVAAAKYGHKLEEHDFYRLFDPALPTIVLDAHRNLEGKELLGVAAAERISRGAGVANILYITAATDCARIVADASGGARMVVSHALLADASGDVYAGELPIPVHADLFDIASPLALRQCREYGIPTINSAHTLDKINFLQVAAEAKVATPRRYELNELWQENPAAEYVIKPSSSSSGRGVRMFAGVADRTVAHEYFWFLNQHGYEPVIERRIRSTPLYVDGAELDWNARVLVCEGKIYDAYIRAGTPGGPVSAYQGASEFPLNNLPMLAGSAERADHILTEVLFTADRWAKVLGGYGYVGVDITVDQEMKGVTFEVNGNDVEVGGASIIAGFEQSREHKLMNFNQLLDAWAAPLTPAGFAPNAGSLPYEPLAREIVTYAIGLWRAGHHDGLANITEAEITFANPTHWELKMWLEHSYHGAALRDDTNLNRELDERFMRMAPVEFPMGLLAVAHLRPGSTEEIRSYFRKYQALMPRNRYWERLRSGPW